MTNSFPIYVSPMGNKAFDDKNQGWAKQFGCLLDHPYRMIWMNEWGKKLIDEDRQAENDIQNDIVINRDLLIARILFDGGYYNETLNKLNKLSVNEISLNNDLSIQSNYNHVADQIDVTSLVDYVLINSFVVCTDWINWNTSWWRGLNPNGTHQKWGYILWDEDATFHHYINYTNS